MGPCHEKHLCEKLSALWEAGLGQVEGDCRWEGSCASGPSPGKGDEEAEESRTVGVC